MPLNMKGTEPLRFRPFPVKYAYGGCTYLPYLRRTFSESASTVQGPS